MLRRYLPPSLCISTYIYIYIVYTPCDRSTCIDNETLETNRASKRSHLGDIDREMFHGYRRIYRTRSSAVKEKRRRRRVIIELRHDNIDRESGNGNSRGRINRYQFVPLPLAFPPEFSSSITGTVIVICRLSAIAISRCSRILSIFLSIARRCFGQRWLICRREIVKMGESLLAPRLRFPKYIAVVTSGKIALRDRR